MNTTIKKIKSLMMACLLLIGVFAVSFESYAATAKITFSDPSVTVGQNVTVTMTIESTDGAPLGSADVMLKYDAALLEFKGGDNANGGAGSIKLVNFTSSSNSTSMSFSLNFTALAPGQAVISVVSQEVYSFNEELMAMDRIGSSSVSIQAPVTYSSEALLTGLEVSPGTLSPAFSSGTSAYSMSVGADVDKVTVSAKASHSGAKVSISGNTSLKAGTNTITCRVTAEDNQTVKNYTITVTKAAGESTAATTEVASESEPGSSEEIASSENVVNVDGISYQFGVLSEEMDLPAGFVLDSYQFEGQSVSALTGIENDLVLFYLIDEDENGAYYIYEEAMKGFYQYQILTIDAKTYTLIPVSSEGLYIPNGFSMNLINIDGQTIEGWVLANDLAREFCLFYGMNEKGEKNLYIYDFTEKTIQRYMEWEFEANPADSQDFLDMQLEYNDLIDEYNRLGIIVMVLGIISVGLAVLAFILFIFRSQKSDKVKSRTKFKAGAKAKNKKVEKVDDIDEDAYFEFASTKEASNEVIKQVKTQTSLKKETVPKSTESVEPEVDDEVDIDELTALLREFEIEDLEEEKKEEQPVEEAEDDGFEFFDLDD